MRELRTSSTGVTVDERASRKQEWKSTEEMYAIEVEWAKKDKENMQRWIGDVGKKWMKTEEKLWLIGWGFVRRRGSWRDMKCNLVNIVVTDKKE